MPRGMQQRATDRFLISAFPHLRDLHTRDGQRGYQVLVTDKTSQNLLIPAAIPSPSGFTARELKDIAGQGSLYLRLMVPSDGLVEDQAGAIPGGNLWQRFRVLAL